MLRPCSIWTEIEISLNALIYSKVVDKSTLCEGFALPNWLVRDFTAWFGTLEIGEVRDITIMLYGTPFAAKLQNLAFDRKKWPGHADIYQVRYPKNKEFASALQRAFPTSYGFVEAQTMVNRLHREQTGVRRNVSIPTDLREYLALFRTADPSVWMAEIVTKQESEEFGKSVSAQNVSEEQFEYLLKNDEHAGIIFLPRLVKVRELDRSVCDNLKILYGFRCQICGQLVAEKYGGKVIEAHHIDPFTRSLNNNYDNIVVLCPNHHRIVHVCHPEFLRRDSPSFLFPNGLCEALLLDKHLRLASRPETLRAAEQV